MFRYEVGAKILVLNRENPECEPTQVEILAKAPNAIKVLVLSDGWFKRHDIRILTDDRWFSISRMK